MKMRNPQLTIGLPMYNEEKLLLIGGSGLVGSLLITQN